MIQQILFSREDIVYCIRSVYYLVMVNVLKRILKLLQFYISFLPPGHTKECDLILTLCLNSALIKQCALFY